MASKKINPVSAVQGSSAGSDILSSAAWDGSETRPSHAFLQQRFVARRARLSPNMIDVVAALAFGGAV